MWTSPPLRSNRKRRCAEFSKRNFQPGLDLSSVLTKNRHMAHFFLLRVLGTEPKHRFTERQRDGTKRERVVSWVERELGRRSQRYKMQGCGIDQEIGMPLIVRRCSLKL